MQEKITGERLQFQKYFMKKSAAPKTVRKPRSDAQRNREGILEVARQVFYPPRRLRQHGRNCEAREDRPRHALPPFPLHAMSCWRRSTSLKSRNWRRRRRNCQPNCLPSRPCERSYWY